MNVKLVLDTCAVRNRDFVQWLIERTSGDVCIPSVAYMELYRQTINNKRSIDSLLRLMRLCNIKVLPFDRHDAEVAAQYMARETKVCPACNKLDWTDTMIYASVGNPPTVFVTENVNDFPTDHAEYIMTPQRVMDTM